MTTLIGVLEVALLVFLFARAMARPREENIEWEYFHEREGSSYQSRNEDRLDDSWELVGISNTGAKDSIDVDLWFKRRKRSAGRTADSSQGDQ